MLYYFFMRSAKLCCIDENPLFIEVGSLKTIISSQQEVPEDNIILIANGGSCVQEGLLSNYNCGDNETNPVFVYLRLQKKLLINATEQSPTKKEFLQNMERLEGVFKKSGNSLTWLRENESISVVVLESSQKIKQQIETLIRDQYLLVEGWNAAVANLCDSLQSIEKRIIAMKDNLVRFQDCELEKGFQMMEKFDERKMELEKVPLLKALLKDCGVYEELPVNLLQWVLYKDKETTRHVTVQSIVTEAHEAYCTLMDTHNDNSLTLEEIKNQWGKRGMVSDVITGIHAGEELVEKCRPVQLQCQEDCEEERSLDTGRDHYTSNKAYMERLNYLGAVRICCEKLMGIIQTHREYAEHTVRQCKEPVGNTVLQDHCVNGKMQLENLGKHYSQLAEWLHKVYCSKADLVKNIDDRKSWLMKYETSICKVDENLFLAKEQMKRVRTGCKVLEQMSTAPRIYAQGVAEIRRRQQLVEMWYSWGTRCSQSSRDLRLKDLNLRKEFDHDLENHFIQGLFSSLHSFSLPKIGNHLLNSSPPTLPHISEDDVNVLAKSLPDLVQFLKVPQIDQTLFYGITDNQSFISGMTAQCQEACKPAFNKPIKDSYASLEDVSLMPVPEDINTNLEELYLSVQGIQSSHKITTTVKDTENSSEAESSKMARSIDSMDFQLTNDKTTETSRDLVCVPQSILDRLLLNTRDLKMKLESVRSQCHQHEVEWRTLVTESAKLLRESTAETIERQTNKTQPSQTSFIEDPRKIQFTHKEFVVGDTVCFTAQIINDTLQWRLLSSDNRIGFLHDDCRLSTERARKSSVLLVRSAEAQSTQSPMRQSQLSPDISRPSHSSTSLIWGTFISKEEYISKKSGNRYGLPIDTKFFRVRANINGPILS